jgi:membrane protein insertase Oxa1/YidC/SpoIIIJ
MKLFKNEWKWPFKGCLTMLIQIPIFIWLYRVILAISQIGDWNTEMIHSRLYSFFYSFWEQYTNIQNIKSNFLRMDLLNDEKWDIILSIIVTVLYYLQMQLTQITQSKKSMPKVPGATMPDMSKMMWFMNIWMSLMMGFMVLTLKSAVGLYLLTSCLFSICQFSRRYRAILKAKWNEKFHKNEPTIIEPTK